MIRPGGSLGLEPVDGLHPDNTTFFVELAQDVKVRPPSLEFSIFINSKDTFTRRRMAQQAVSDTLTPNQPARDSMTGHHNAEPARFEMKGGGVRATGERVVNEHELPLEALESITGLNENLG